MTTRAKLQGLADISALALDQRLAALRQMQARRQAIIDLIAALDLAPVTTDLPLAAAQRAEVSYLAWADKRRTRLNLQLAQANVAVLQAEAEARLVFARNSVVTGLRSRLAAAERRRQ
jgi:transcriptional accessory protein Tex/SPT6